MWRRTRTSGADRMYPTSDDLEESTVQEHLSLDVSPSDARQFPPDVDPDTHRVLQLCANFHRSKVKGPSVGLRLGRSSFSSTSVRAIQLVQFRFELILRSRLSIAAPDSITNLSSDLRLSMFSSSPPKHVRTHVTHGSIFTPTTYVIM